MRRIPLLATGAVVLALVVGACTAGRSKPAASGTAPTTAPGRPAIAVIRDL